MAVTLDGLTRPKANTVNSIDLALAIAPATEYDVVGTGREGFFIPVNLVNLDPQPFNIANVVIVSSDTTITTTGNAFSLVKVGDAVSGTGIAANTTVASITDLNTIELSAAATTSETITITVTPPVDQELTLFALGIDLVKSGNNLVAKFKVYQFEGNEGEGEAAENNAMKTLDLNQIAIDLDSFLTLARIPRTN